MVLLVLDGLGWNALQEHAHRLPTISGMAGGPITTVVPSTTATALTSICTGLTPAQHGVLGYRMVVGGEVLNVLRWSSQDARPPDPFDVQRHTAFLGRDVPVVTKSEFRNSGFSNAHLRGARFIGWSTVSVLVEHCVRLVASGDRFVYAYYPGVDNIAHEFGLHNGFYERELAVRGSSGRRPPHVVAARHGAGRDGGSRADAPRTRRLDRSRCVGAARRRDGG